MQDVIDFNLLKEYDAALKEVLGVWTKQKAYSLGDKVEYKGHLLECTTAGTSGTTTLNFTSLVIGDTIIDGTVVWELVEEESGRGIDFYTAGESYNIDDIVIYSGNIYQCTTAHTATSTFDATKWAEISASGEADLPEWQANTSYTAGKYLVHEGTVYKVTTNFTSGIEFDDTNLSAYIAPIMVGADDEDDGTAGLVPVPTSNDISKFLCGDGTWKSVGGSGLNVGQTVLWEGYTNTINTNYTLSDEYTNYDYLMFCVTYESGLNQGTLKSSCIVEVGSYNNFELVFPCANEERLVKFDIDFTGNTWNIGIYTDTNTTNKAYMHKIIGFKLYNPNNYSTTEQEIGTWIDGKKLYQVTLTGNLPATVDTDTVVASISDLDTIVEFNGFGRDNTTCVIPFNYGKIGNSFTTKDFIAAYLNSEDIYVTVSVSGYCNQPFWLTVKYTKV